MFNIKVPITAGVAAFLLAVISGGIAGIAFPVLMLRSMLSAILFAAAGVGVWYAARNFLPELFDDDKQNKKGTSGENGNNVDIVMESDEPPASFDQPDSGMTEMFDKKDLNNIDLMNGKGDDLVDEAVENMEPLKGNSDDTEESPNELDAVDEINEDEITEENSTNDSINDNINMNEEENDGNKNSMNTDKHDSDNDNTSMYNEQQQKVASDFGDIEEFSNSFLSPDIKDDYSENSTPSSQKHNDSMDGEDPTTMAKAVQTMLKKDND